MSNSDGSAPTSAYASPEVRGDEERLKRIIAPPKYSYHYYVSGIFAVFTRRLLLRSKFEACAVLLG